MFESLQKHGYTVHDMIGKGAYGQCFMVTHKRYAHEQFVCKVIQVTSEEKKATILSTFTKEINVLSKIIHSHIVKIYDYWSEENLYFIILEYCSNGSLRTYLRTKRKIDSPTLRRFIKEIASALEYCHSQRICHHDLKPENILLDGNNRIKVADFGLALFDTEGLSKHFGGSFPYKPPEILLRKPFDVYKADVWSFGVTIYELVFGMLPWDGTSEKEILTQISLGYDFFDEHVPEDIETVIKKCLNVDPNKRPSFAEIKEMVSSPPVTHKSNSLMTRNHSLKLSRSLMNMNLIFTDHRHLHTNMITKPVLPKKGSC